MFVSLNFEWRENRLHLVTLTHSNIFKFKKPRPLCLCFLIRFSEEEAEATEDFHMSISCLFKNKITVGNSQLFNNFFSELLNVPPLISCLFFENYSIRYRGHSYVDTFVVFSLLQMTLFHIHDYSWDSSKTVRIEIGLLKNGWNLRRTKKNWYTCSIVAFRTMLGEMRLLLQLQSSVTKLIQNIDSVIFYCNSTLVVDTTTDLIMSITATIKLLIFNFI